MIPRTLQGFWWIQCTIGAWVWRSVSVGSRLSFATYCVMKSGDGNLRVRVGSWKS